jgi:hypothetical protein
MSEEEHALVQSAGAPRSTMLSSLAYGQERGPSFTPLLHTSPSRLSFTPIIHTSPSHGQERGRLKLFANAPRYDRLIVLSFEDTGRATYVVGARPAIELGT